MAAADGGQRGDPGEVETQTGLGHRRGYSLLNPSGTEKQQQDDQETKPRTMPK